MAIKATGRATFTAVEDYDIVFVLNGIRRDVLNFDSVRTAESAALEADFYNGGTSCVVDKAVLCCYDGEGTLLGSPIEVHDTSTAVADGGNLYLSKDCKTITCDIYAGDKKLLSKTLPVIRDGSSVGVKAVSYKVINNVAANASLNWDSVTSQTAYPTQKPDKGKYCYVMTIVLYTDGTSTNTVSTSYTPNDGVAGTSVKVMSTKVEYAGGDSGTTAPTSGWQGTVPQLSQGKYLWTRTTVAYSDGNSTTSYSVGRIGMDGSKGGTTHILYASSDHPSSADDVRTTIDASHQYYGTYQDTALDDDVNKYKSVTSWVLIKGEKGDNGIVYDVYLSASLLKGDSTGKLNSKDSVAVSAKVVKVSGGTATNVTNVSEAYFTISRTTDSGDIVNYPSGNFTSYTLQAFGTGVKTWNFALYVGGVFLKTVTVPVIRDGKNGDGTPATVYTIEPWGSISASGMLKDANTIRVTVKGNVKAYKTTGDKKEEYSSQPQSWRLSIGGANYDGTTTFDNNASNNIISFSLTQDYSISGTVPGAANIALFSDSSHSKQLASLIVPVSLNAGVIVDVNSKLGTIQSTTSSMQGTVNWMHGTIETIRQGQGQIALKVQDLQNGGIDTGKPHTSSQVDFTTLDSDNFYPVMIKLKDDDGVRHTVEIDRPLDAAYGSGKGYMTHSGGFSFRLVFSDIANAWDSYEYGQLRIESVSQYWTKSSDTPICPRIAQYYQFSYMVAWLRGGSKYDITVDCADAYISGIWPYMMQVESNPSWVPDVVRLAPYTWTTDQVNAQGGNPYNLLQHDSGGFYADTDKEYLYRFGEMIAGNTFAIVGQPKDSKQWFVATWKIASVSGSKVYVDTSTYGILWQTQNPLGIRMNGILGYIKKGVSYSKSTWDSEQGFGTSESLDNTAVHANWVAPRPILVIGKESSATNGVYRDRAVLESVESCSEEDSVFFYSGTYFDVSPLYGTDGRTNVKTDLLATGIDIKSHKILITSDNVKVRNNKGEETTAVDAQGNLTAGSLTCKDKVSGTVMSIMNGFFSALKGKAGVSLGVDENGYPCLMGTDPNGNVLWRLGQTYETADQDSKVTMEVVSMKAYGQMNSYAIGEGVILTLNVTNNTNAAITINTSNMHMVLKSEFGTYRGNVDVVTNISVGATAQVVLRGTEAIDTSSSSSTYTSPVGRSVTAVVVYQGDMRLTQDAEYQYQEGLRKDSDGNVQYTLPLM